MVISADFSSVSALGAAMPLESSAISEDEWLAAEDEAAAPLNPEELADLLLDSHDLYLPDECALNCQRFVRSIDHARTPPDLEAIVILHSQVKDWLDFRSWVTAVGIRSLLASGPNESSDSFEFWNYHTLLVSGGRVYDFDFDGEPGTPLKDYVESMFGGAMQCLDCVRISATALAGEERSIYDCLLNGDYTRVSFAEYVKEVVDKHGRLAPLGVERRDENYEKWGLLRSEIVRGGATDTLRLTYEPGSDFSMERFARLIGDAVIKAFASGKEIDELFVDMWFHAIPDMDESDLHRFVRKAVRSSGFSGRATLLVRSFVNPVPRTFSFEV